MRITREVAATDAGLEAHRRIPLSLTFDHRCVTGGEAVRFLAGVIKIWKNRPEPATAIDQG